MLIIPGIFKIGDIVSYKDRSRNLLGPFEVIDYFKEPHIKYGGVVFEHTPILRSVWSYPDGRRYTNYRGVYETYLEIDVKYLREVKLKRLLYD